MGWMPKQVNVSTLTTSCPTVVLTTFREGSSRRGIVCRSGLPDVDDARAVDVEDAPAVPCKVDAE